MRGKFQRFSQFPLPLDPSHQGEGRKIFITAFIFLLLLFPLSLSAKDLKAPSWRTLLPGLQEAKWTPSDAQGNLIAFQLYKIDLKKFKIQVVQAKDYQQKKMSAKSFALRSGGVIAVNGGFFDPSYQNLGLIVQNGKTLNPLKPISWWGVFSIDQKQIPRVEKVRDFQSNRSHEMAIQSGPRLVENGVPVRVKSNLSQKTFIGIDQDQEVILGVTDGSVVDAVDFARLLASELKLKSALNFDGGGSTQLYAKIRSYQKELPGFTEVANGVVVLPRK